MRSHLANKLKVVALLALTVMMGCSPPDNSKELQPLIEAYVEAWNTGNFDNLDRIADPDFELRMTPKFEPTKSLDSLKWAITYWRTAYPDFHITKDEVIYGKDAAAALWTITATNTGPGLFPPTGKRVDVQGMSILHFAEGKITDEWIAGNNLLWLKQLGYTLIPPAEVEE